MPCAIGARMSDAFKRYSGLVTDKRVSYRALALCGRLITADARYHTMVSALHKFGHRGGPTTFREWVRYGDEGDEVHAEFDQAWTKFGLEFSDQVVTAADDNLRAAIEGATRRFNELIARYPDQERLFD